MEFNTVALSPEVQLRIKGCSDPPGKLFFLSLVSARQCYVFLLPVLFNVMGLPRCLISELSAFENCSSLLSALSLMVSRMSIATGSAI